MISLFANNLVFLIIFIFSHCNYTTDFYVDDTSQFYRFHNLSFFIFFLKAYGRIFIGKIHHKHVVAKQHFAKLTKMGKQQVPKPPPPKGANFNRIAGTESG